MRKKLYGIIYAGEENLNLRELVSKRPVGALPIGARYRIIDFVLSGMVNSGVRNVGVITRRNYHSLMDHIGGGKAWDLSRKEGGLYMLPPHDADYDHVQYGKTNNTLKGLVSYIERTPQQYCLVSGCSYLYNSSYDKMLDFHISSGADITVLYTKEIQENNYDEMRFSTDSVGRVINAKCRGYAEGCDKTSMGVYIINNRLLKYLVDNASSGIINLIADSIEKNIDRLNVCAFEHEGYVARIDNVSSYLRANLDILQPSVQKALFHNPKCPVYTKIKDEAPTKYGTDAKVKNSIVGSGCIINGEVENCILFRGVEIAEGAVVKNSVIMQSSKIYANASLQNVILDKKVTVRPDAILSGTKDYPIIIPKSSTV